LTTLLLCNDNHANCDCTGFCAYSSSPTQFNTKIYADDADCTTFEYDGVNLQNFAANIQGLLYDWDKQCDPCAQYYNGSTVYYMSQWSGVECSYNYGGVYYLRLQSKGLSGTINFTALPTTLEILNMRDNAITGEIKTDNFASASLLTELYLANNELTGSISFLGFQGGNIRIYDVHGNNLTGSIDLTQLPGVLQYLALSDNFLSGNVNFAAFQTNSSTVQVLNIANNQFTGEANISFLNDGLTQLDISGNEFYNPIYFQDLPSTLTLMYLQDNYFYGDDSSFTSLPDNLLDIDISSNEFTASIETLLNAIKNLDSIRFVQADNNQFQGPVDFSNLPTTLQTLDLSSNYITYVSSWGTYSQKNSSNLTYLSVCSNKISQQWDPTDLPNAIQQLYICDNNFTGTIDLSKLPINITEFDASKNLLLSGTISFSNLPEHLDKVFILNTGVDSPVIFTGMSSSAPYLEMAKEVYCEPSVYCPANGCYKSNSRTSTTCRGLEACEDTCECRFCNETTLTPTSNNPTIAPTNRPTKKPTYPPGEPTPYPTATPPPTKAPTRKPTYPHSAQVTIYDASGSTELKFIPNNQYQIIGKVYNYTNLYWDKNYFFWICENCDSGPINFTALGNDYVVEPTREGQPWYSTLTLYPETSTTTYCTYSSLITDGYMSLGQHYNLTLYAYGFSEYNQDEFLYTE